VRVKELDWLDKALIFELYADARISIQELSRKYRVAFNTIKDRINKLEKKGAIIEYTIELSMEMLGADWLFIDIITNGTENTKEFIEKIGNYPLVRFAYRIGNQRYYARAIVAGTTQFFELKQFIESLSAITKVELHPFVWIVPGSLPFSKARTRGQKVVFTKNELRILQCLTNDVRMPVSKIAKQTGMKVRQVAKTLRELHENGGVHFTIRMMMADPVELVLFLRYNDTITKIDQIANWLQERYPLEFWGGASWLDEPVFEVIIVPGAITKFGEIIREVRAAPFTDSVEDHIFSYDSLVAGQYRGPSHARLEEMFREAGLSE
jgi:DNA-binding Lrp family transcriptional regulator